MDLLIFCLQYFGGMVVEQSSRLSIKIEMQMQYKLPRLLYNITWPMPEFYLHFSEFISKECYRAFYWPLLLAAILNDYFHVDANIAVDVKFKVNFRESKLSESLKCSI